VRLIHHLSNPSAGHTGSYLSGVDENFPDPIEWCFNREGVGKFHSYLSVTALHALALDLGASRSLLRLCLGQTALLRWRLIKAPALELRDNCLRVALPSFQHAFEIAASIVHSAAPIIHAATPILHAATPIIHAAASIVRPASVFHPASVFQLCRLRSFPPYTYIQMNMGAHGPSAPL